MGGEKVEVVIGSDAESVTVAKVDLGIVGQIQAALRRHYFNHDDHAKAIYLGGHDRTVLLSSRDVFHYVTLINGRPHFMDHYSIDGPIPIYSVDCRDHLRVF